MKVIVLKDFCGIKKDAELNLPEHLAFPLISQNIVKEVKEADKKAKK